MSSFAPFPFLLLAVAAGFASTSFDLSSLPAAAVFVFFLGLAAFGSAGLLDGSASTSSLSKSK